MYYQPQEKVVYVRFHLDVPVTQPVDIYLNDHPVYRGLTYRQFTHNIPLQEGMYTLKAYSQGQLLISQNVNVDGNKLIKIYSPEGEKIKLMVEKEEMPYMGQQPHMMAPHMTSPHMGTPYQPFMYQPQQYPKYEQPWQPSKEMVVERDKPIKEKARVRFIHLSPNAPAVDITLPNGTPLFENIPYKGVTPYIDVAPGTYTLQVRPTGTDQVVLTIPNFVIGPNEMKTIYAIGLVGGTPALEAYVVNERMVRE